jgi:hypothetical protein
VNMVMNLWVPLNTRKLPSGYSTGGLWSSAQLHSTLVKNIEECLEGIKKKK